MLSPLTLLITQIAAHLSFVYLLIYGSIEQWGVAFFVYFLTGCLGMTMNYHRLLSHKSWSAPLWFRYFGALIAAVGLTGSAISWVAIHRKHHKYTDTDKDPHSPNFKSFIYCQWLSMYEPVELKYVLDLTRENFFIYQHKFYFLISFFYAGLLWVIDPMAVLYAWLVPACILWNAGSSIVTFSHLFGRRPHIQPNKAGNNWFLGIFVWGEGWHNNHHKTASNPFFGEFWWQIDVGGWLIRCLQKK